MDEVSDAFKFVLGEEFINEMIERLKIIGLAVGILLIVIIIA